MKFLIIAHRFHTNLYYRAKALQDNGDEVKIVVLYEGKSEYKKGLDYINIGTSEISNFLTKFFIIYRKNNLKSNFELRIQSPGRELEAIIQSYNPDVILLKAFQNSLALKTLKLARKYNIKVLMLIQTGKTNIIGSQKLFLKNISYFNRKGVSMYITPVFKNFELFKATGIENISYLPFVFPAQDNNPDYNSDKIKIMSIGKYSKRKDHLLLMKAVFKLFEKNYNISLDIYGEKADPDYYEELLSYLKTLPEGLVRLHENLAYDSILEEYKRHHLFVLPSYAEPAAYSPVEAMGNALPVICSDECGTKCYITEGENGFIFKAKDLNDLTNKIETAIKDKEKLAELSEKALLTVKVKHNPFDFAKRIKEIIFQD